MSMAPAGESSAKGKSRVRIDINERCRRCGICIEFCARGVLAGDSSSAMPIVVVLERCNACRLCELRCPEASIVVTEE